MPNHDFVWWCSDKTTTWTSPATATPSRGSPGSAGFGATSSFAKSPSITLKTTSTFTVGWLVCVLVDLLAAVGSLVGGLFACLLAVTCLAAGVGRHCWVGDPVGVPTMVQDLMEHPVRFFALQGGWWLNGSTPSSCPPHCVGPVNMYGCVIHRPVRTAAVRSGAE